MSRMSPKLRLFNDAQIAVMSQGQAVAERQETVTTRPYSGVAATFAVWKPVERVEHVSPSRRASRSNVSRSAPRSNGT